MTIDRPLKDLFDLLPAERPPEPKDLNERRRQAKDLMMLLGRPSQPGVMIEEQKLLVDRGEISVRTYRPENLPQNAPVFFFLHGGGWFQGDLDTAEIECGPVASPIQAFVVSVDYRLAPEYKFPIPLDDCVAAYMWVLDNGESLGVDTSRIAVGGASAGGNLAAALCLVCRDRGLTMPCLQLLDVPGLDLSMESSSMREFEKGYGLTAADVDECVYFYVTNEEELKHPRVSPLHEPDLGGLPPALILTAEFDPVRDDGERYAARLRDAGVPAAAFRATGHFHGSWVIPFTVTSGLVADLRVATLRRAFAGTLVPGT